MAKYNAGKMGVLMISLSLLWNLVAVHTAPERQMRSWLGDKKSPLTKGVILGGWDAAPGQTKPRAHSLAFLGKGLYKRDEGETGDSLCREDKSKREARSFQHVTKTEADSVLFTSEENGELRMDVMLIPSMRPSPDDLLKNSASLVEFNGFAKERPVKRGWEAITLCTCCLRDALSHCCRKCRGLPMPSRTSLSPSRKKHIKTQNHTTMCMCCYWSQAKFCCALCNKRVQRSWCC